MHTQTSSEHSHVDCRTNTLFIEFLVNKVYFVIQKYVSIILSSVLSPSKNCKYIVTCAQKYLNICLRLKNQQNINVDGHN